jgi:hypothetical protein
MVMIYPPDHALALARVLRVIEIIADRPDISNEELVAQLVSDGIDPVDAHLLMAFVPTALSYPFVVRMGASDLPRYYMVGKRPGSKRSVLLPLEEEH